MKTKELSKSALKNIKNIEVPTYNLERQLCPILHIGVGNFHRSHQANYLHKLLQEKDSSWRICGAGLMPQDIKMKEALQKQDQLYTLVSQESDSEHIKIIGSINDYVHIPSEVEKFNHVFTSDELKIVTLTVTEKGYSNTSDWDLDINNNGIKHDLEKSDEIPVTAIGILAYGLKQRMLLDAPAITIMSCDNLPANGELLRHILMQFIDLQKDQKLREYINKFVKFPSSMVDRITPITTDEKKEYLVSKYGIIDSVPVFSEEFIQWVIEDDFNVERPEWERLGVQIVDNVKPFELMKTRLLNGGHSALAFPSLLAGFVFVDDAMRDSVIIDFVRNYMNEVKVTLDPIDGVDYDAYIEKLLLRFANPAVKDRILRLAEDSSSKFLNFIVNPLIMLLKKGKETPAIIFVLASWIVYLSKSLTNGDYEVKDPIGPKIQKVAGQSLVDSSLFISLKEIFPEEILEYKNFLTELDRVIKSILEDGIDSALANVNESLK